MFHLVRHAFAFKLNEGAFEDLTRKGLPADVLDALQPIKDREFASRRELTSTLPRFLGETSPKRYVSDVVGAARVLRPRRLLRGLRQVWQLRVPPSRLAFAWGKHIAMRPAVLALRLRLRWWRFAMQHRFSRSKAIAQAPNANASGFAHNRKQVLSFQVGHRNRTESLMNVLRTIQAPNLEGAKLLCVGPRNEAELFLLDAYGFPLRNIESIDLFSYSPLIKLMDMNALEYPDNTFDIYYSSAVIRYSPDVRKTVAESIRVTRPGGIMAYGFTYGLLGDLVPTGSEMTRGIADLLELYAGHVDHVYWQEEFAHSPGDFRATAIFRLKK